MAEDPAARERRERDEHYRDRAVEQDLQLADVPEAAAGVHARSKSHRGMRNITFREFVVRSERPVRDHVSAA